MRRLPCFLCIVIGTVFASIAGMSAISLIEAFSSNAHHMTMSFGDFHATTETLSGKLIAVGIGLAAGMLSRTFVVLLPDRMRSGNARRFPA